MTNWTGTKTQRMSGGARDIRAVKLYGGSWHGRTIDMDIFQSRRLEVRQDDPVMPRLAHMRPSDGLLPMHTYTLKTYSYYLDQYRAEYMCPRRHRERWFGQIEGTDLLMREVHELQRDLEGMPWEFPKVSILTEFEDWWSQQVYKRTGRMTWEGRTVRP